MASYQTNLLYETNQMPSSKVKPLGADEIFQSYNEVPTVCPICGEGVQMIVAEKAATVCQCSRRKIYRWIEQGDLHFFEISDGEVLVCGRSLSQKMDELESRTDRFSEREKKFEMAGGSGKKWTQAEQEAGANGTRQLTQDDPGPQTIYRVAVKPGAPLLVNVGLRYSRPETKARRKNR